MKTPLDANQIRNVIVSGRNEPLLDAVMLVLENNYRDEVEGALNASSDAQARAYDCGRAASLRDAIMDLTAIRDGEGAEV